MVLHRENAPRYEGLSSSEALLEMIYGFTKSQAIFVAAKLGIADLLSKGSKSCEELAQATGVNAHRLAQLMRMLVTIDVFSMDENNNFTLSPIGAHLRTGTSNSLRGTALAMGEELYPAWGNLLHGIKTDDTAFDYSFKTSLYGYLAQNYEAAKNFNDWMKETTREWLLPVLEAYDFSNIKTLIDVGGNIGALSAVILKANPQMQAILFDQEDVVAGAEKVLSAAGVADRCKIIGGNFFDSIPTGGNLYLISRVLLNWDDAHAIKILNNCYQAMTDQDHLLIVDFVLHRGKTSSFMSMININLFALCGLFMRTEDEFGNLLSSAGFEVTKIIQTKGPVSAIEARPTS